MSITRGKLMVKKSLKPEIEKRMKRVRHSPLQEAEWWVHAGLDQDGFQLHFFNKFKGYGVLTSRTFVKGEFLLQYVGDKISNEEAVNREKKKNNKRSCFLFFFQFNANKLCIDASNTRGRFGHMVNDAPVPSSNCKMKLIRLSTGQPALCLFALKDIAVGEELFYDYGDNSDNLWWRNEKQTDEQDIGTCSSDEESDPFGLLEKESLESNHLDEKVTGKKIGCGIEEECHYLGEDGVDYESRVDCINLSKDGVSVDKDIDKVHHGDYSIVKDSDRAHHGEGTVEKDSDQVHHGEDSVDKDSDQVHHGEDRVDKDCDSVHNVEDSVDKDSERAHHGEDSVDKDSDQVHHGEDSVDKDSDQVHHGEDRVDKDCDSVHNVEDSVDKDSDRVHHGEDRVDKDCDRVHHGEDRVDKDCDQVHHGEDSVDKDSDQVHHGEDSVDKDSDSVHNVEDSVDKDSDSVHNVEDSVDKDSDRVHHGEDRVDKDCDRVHHGADRVDKDSDSVHNVEDSVDKDSDRVHHGEDRVDKDCDRVHHGADRVDKDSDSVHKGEDRVDKDCDRVHHGEDRVDKDCDRVHHGADRVDKDSDSVHKGEDRVDKDCDRVHHGEDRVDKDSDRVHHGEDRVDKDSDRVHHGEDSVDKDCDRVHHGADRVDKDSDSVHKGEDRVDKDCDRVHHGEDRVDKDCDRVHHGEDRVDKDSDSVHKGEDRVDKDCDRVHHGEDRVDKDCDRVHHGADRVDKDSDSVHKGEDRVDKDCDRVHHGEDRVDKDCDRVHHGADRVDKDSDSVHKGEDRVDKDCDRVHHGEDRVDKDSDRVHHGEDRVDKDSDSVHNVEDSVDKDCDRVHHGEDSVDKDCDRVHHGEDRVDKDIDRACNGEDICSVDKDIDRACNGEDICSVDKDIDRACNGEDICSVDKDIDRACNGEDICSVDRDIDRACNGEDICSVDKDSDRACNGEDICSVDRDIDRACNGEDICSVDKDSDRACNGEDICSVDRDIDRACNGEDICSVDRDIDRACNGEDICSVDKDSDRACNGKDICSVDKDSDRTYNGDESVDKDREDFINQQEHIGYQIEARVDHRENSIHHQTFDFDQQENCVSQKENGVDGKQHDMEEEGNEKQREDGIYLVDGERHKHQQDTYIQKEYVTVLDCLEDSRDSNQSQIFPVLNRTRGCEETCSRRPQLSPEKNNHGSTKYKPDRYCIYCKTIVAGGKLKRHILRRHKAEEEVVFILTQPQDKQNTFFEKKRQEGIYEYNMSSMSLSKPTSVLMRERKPKNIDEVRMCGGCKCFYSNRSFYKHRLSCSSLDPDPIKPVFLTSFDLHEDREFVDDILSKFRLSPAGNLCRTDVLIKQVGFRHFCLRRCERSKRDEVRKCVMTEMRELARLLLQFKSLVPDNVSSEEMFTRKYLPQLREAIENLSTGEDGKSEKHGLKLNYNAIILKTIKSLKGLFTETLQDDKFIELGKFHQAYLFRSPEMFANARYKCVANSLDKSRRPQELPDEEAVKTLKIFLSDEIEKVSKCFNLSQYQWLRSLIVTRLTLFNGRRGEEPSRLLLQEFQDAKENVWLPEQDVEKIQDEAERYLIGQFRLAYLHGKGRKYVPVLLPEDLLNPIQVLIDTRIQHGIYEGNNFVFGTKHSKRHCSGWHAVKEVSQIANVHINATRNRHRISTLYAGLHMGEGEKGVFFEHMGHDPAINKDNYQCPQGVREVRVMGPLLTGFDRGDSNMETAEKVKKSLSTGKRKKTVISESESDEDCIIQTKSHSEKRKKAVISEDESEKEDIIMQTYSRSGQRKRILSVNSSDEESPDLRKNSGSVCWTETDTQSLHKYFSTFFADCCSRQDNIGSLPKSKSGEENQSGYMGLVTCFTNCSYCNLTGTTQIILRSNQAHIASNIPYNRVSGAIAD